MAGFTSGDGGFYITIYTDKNNTNRIRAKFTIVQNIKDVHLINSFKSYFSCGNISLNNDLVVYNVSDVKDLITHIVPFFKKYSVQGVKSLDFNDWVLALNLISSGQHLKPEGIEMIRKIKDGMNSKRMTQEVFC